MVKTLSGTVNLKTPFANAEYLETDACNKKVLTESRNCRTW